MAAMKTYLPRWLWPWLDVLVPAAEIVLVLLLAWLLRAFVRHLIARVSERYEFPPMAVIGARRVATLLIGLAALLGILQVFGVEGSVLWGALTGFAAMAAVAFFAAWSVLANIFCSFLILVTRPFRLFDHIELLENGEKPGLRGQVTDINLIYTRLLETHADGCSSTLHIPNSQFFQRAVRRWNAAPDHALHAAEAGGESDAPPRIGGGATAASADPD